MCVVKICCFLLRLEMQRAMIGTLHFMGSLIITAWHVILLRLIWIISTRCPICENCRHVHENIFYWLTFINFNTLPSPYDFNYIAAVMFFTIIHNFVCCKSWKYHILLDCKVLSYTPMTWLMETFILISHCIEWNEAPRLNLFSSTFHTVKDTDTRWKVSFIDTTGKRYDIIVMITSCWFWPNKIQIVLVNCSLFKKWTIVGNDSRW